MNIPLTPLRFVEYAERQYPERIAVVCGEQRFTYREFATRVRQLAGVLRGAGVRPGDRVAFLAVNSHRLLEAYYGVLDAGAVLLPLNIRLSGAELSYILNDAGASVLFFDEQFLPVVDNFRKELSTTNMLYQMSGTPAAPWTQSLPMSQLMQQATPHRLDPALVDENSVAELFYTSGTSARPKGVMLTHRNIYLHAVHTCLALGTSHGGVELHTIPLFHANGWGVPHFLVLMGGKHVMISHFQPTEVFRLIQQERVQSFKAVPAMATALVNHPERSHYDLSSLRQVFIGGSAASPTLIREVEEAFACECYTLYGLTETAPVLSHALSKPGMGLTGDERHLQQAMAGFPIPGVTLGVMGVGDQLLPEDGVAVGEVVARGDGIMQGYWGQPEASAEALRGGWFHTGDMGKLAVNGYLELVDRKKDIIISGGENVSSLEVENTLLAHPDILEIAVIAVESERWGEVPKAFVVRKPGKQVTAAELIAFARERLAHYKCPASVTFVESLPRTGTGKVLKRLLRAEHSKTGGQPARQRSG